MIVLLISTTIIPIVEDLNDTEYIQNSNNYSSYGPYAKIGEGTYDITIKPNSSFNWRINGENYRNPIGVFSENMIGYASSYNSICFKDTSGQWVKIRDGFTLSITGGTATVTFDQTTYTVDVSDGYVIDPDGDFRLYQKDQYEDTYINTLTDDPLIGIGVGANSYGVSGLAYVEFIGTDIVNSLSCGIANNSNLTTDFEFDTVESINDNEAYTFEQMDGYISYTGFREDIDITTSADRDTSLMYVLGPASITVDRTLEGPEYDMIRILPVIMFAGVVIASIGAFVINRRE